MKHRIIIFAVLLLAGGCLSAQNNGTAAAKADGDTLAAPTFPRWSIGAGIGLNINVPDVETAYMTNVVYNPSFGLGANLSVAYQPYKWLAVRSGIHFVPKNYTYLHSITVENQEGSLGSNTNCNYLDVPVMADFSIGGKVRWHLFLGGYVGYWLNGNRNGAAIPLGNRNDDGSFAENYVFNSTRDNRFDAGIIYGTGLGIACSRVVDINIDLLNLYGLTDVQKNYMMQLNPHYNTTFVLQAGVTINLQ